MREKGVWPQIKGSSSFVHPSKSSSDVVDIPKKVGKWARDPKRERVILSHFRQYGHHPVWAHTNTNLLIPYATDYVITWLENHVPPTCSKLRTLLVRHDLRMNPNRFNQILNRNFEKLTSNAWRICSSHEWIPWFFRIIIVIVYINIVYW